MTVAQETWIFLYACLLGALLGMVYDAFRIFRLAFPMRKIAVFIEDTIFVMIVTLATFLFSVRFCSGYFRAFVAVGEVFGFVFYYFTVGELVFRMAKSIIRAIKVILQFLYHIFVRPIFHLFRYLYTKLLSVFKHISQKSPRSFLSAKFHLKHRVKLMYNSSNHRNVNRFKESEESCEKQKNEDNFNC